MIGYFIWMKFKRSVFELKNPWNILLHLFFLLTAWGYGRMIAEAVNKAETGEIENISPETIINIVLGAIACLTLIRMIIPTYKSQKQVLPKHYPLSKWQRYLLSIVSDFQSGYFLYTFIFIIVVFWNLEWARFFFLIMSSSVLLSAHLFRRTLHYLIDYRLRRFSYVYLITGIPTVFLLLLYIELFLPYIIYLSLICLIALFVLGFLLECQIVENKKNEISTRSNKGNYVLKLLVNNKNVFVTLIIAVSIKLLYLGLALVSLKTKGTGIIGDQFYFLMFASPLLIFTYVFNNSWGFWKYIWLNFELRTGRYNDMIKFILQLLIIPVFIDVIISIPILLYRWPDFQFTLLFYFTSLVFLVCLSFVLPLLFPMHIKSAFRMKGNTSFLGSLISISAVLLLLVIKVNNWFYLLIPLYLIAAFVLYKVSITAYNDKKYLLAKKLLKD